TVQKRLLENDEQSKIAVIGLYSDQGNDGQRGGGAHDLDVLGKIVVKHDGNFNFDNDVQVVGVDYGAYGNGAELDQVFGF
ncbi:MAG: calcium-binding protein, partial [Trichodesmium sp. MAG_R01]|nr:calcium-binding protein [Trichodesmium sp. MAG_R01]